MKSDGKWIVRCYYPTSFGIDFDGWPGGRNITSKEDAEELSKFLTDHQIKTYGVCHAIYKAYYRTNTETPW